MKLKITQATHIGRRNNNEDRAFTWQQQIDATLVTVIAVADGMGGHQAGEVASGIAMDILKELCDEISKRNHIEWPQIPAYLESVFRSINQRIKHHQGKRPETQGMGTTLVMAIALDDQVMIANMGDSRAYLLTGQNMRQITRDHSVVAEGIESGLISPEEAEHHPYRHALTRCLDGEHVIDIDFFPARNTYRTLEQDEALLLCSDGLSGVLDDSEIYDHFVQSKSLNQAGNELVQDAYRGGGQDNITVAILENSAFPHQQTNFTYTKPHRRFAWSKMGLVSLLSFSVIALVFMVLLLFGKLNWPSIPFMARETESTPVDDGVHSQESDSHTTLQLATHSSRNIARGTATLVLSNDSLYIDFSNIELFDSENSLVSKQAFEQWFSKSPVYPHLKLSTPGDKDIIRLALPYQKKE